MDPIFTQQFTQPPKQKSGGMFGNNGVGRAIAGMIGDFLLQRAGMQPIYMPSVMQQRQAAMEDARYGRERQDKRDDFTFEQDYRAQHQAPDDFTQMMMAAGIDPNSEQGKALYLQAVQNKANPFTQMRVQNPDGSETLQFMRPPMAPPGPVGKLTPLGAGGPGLGGPGGFLKPF
jgi:hypothetical protein